MTKRAELSTTIGRRFNRNYTPSHIWVKYTNNSFSTNQRQKNQHTKKIWYNHYQYLENTIQENQQEN